MTDMTHFDGISELVAQVLGQKRLQALSKPQENALDGALDRMLQRHKTHQTITPQEILGAYELVVDHVLPTS